MGICTYKKAWLVAWDLWVHQNKVFHEEERVEALTDLPNINQEIKERIED